MKKFLIALFFVPLCLLSGGSIDVVMPAIAKDKEVIEHSLAGLRSYFPDIRNVYVISPEQITSSAEWVSDSSFPFSIDDVQRELGITDEENSMLENRRKQSRARGWFFQQLLKLYAPQVIPGLSEPYLVMDADTIMLKKLNFLTDDGKVIFDVLIDRPFVVKRHRLHGKRLIPELIPLRDDLNPVTHHMLFHNSILQEMFAQVEEIHGKPFWQVFLNEVEKKNGLLRPDASEYTLYFDYFIKYHPSEWAIRVPQMWNRQFHGFQLKTIDVMLDKFKRQGLDFASFHSCLRYR